MSETQFPTFSFLVSYYYLGTYYPTLELENGEFIFARERVAYTILSKNTIILVSLYTRIFSWFLDILH